MMHRIAGQIILKINVPSDLKHNISVKIHFLISSTKLFTDYQVGAMNILIVCIVIANVVISQGNVKEAGKNNSEIQERSLLIFDRKFYFYANIHKLHNVTNFCTPNLDALGTILKSRGILVVFSNLDKCELKQPFQKFHLPAFDFHE